MFTLLCACVATVTIDDDTGTKTPVDTDTAAVDSGDTGDTHDSHDTHDTHETGDTDTGDTAETGDTDDTWPTQDTAPFDCSTDIPELPVDMVADLAVTGSEDFTFLLDGRIATVDGTGSLVTYEADGTKTLIYPKKMSGGGISQLPDGNLVLGDRSTNTIVEIGLDGSKVTLTSTNSWSNGIRVGPDGMIYYDEGTGKAWRLDPDTLEQTLVADELYSPNGIVVGDDGVVYIGDDYGWIDIVRPDGAGGYYPAALYGEVPGATSPMHGCDGKVAGDACYVVQGYSWTLGVCGDDGGGGVSCDAGYDYASCDGLSDGDPCTTERFGETIVTTCHEDVASSRLFCPRVTVEGESACTTKNEPCTTTAGDGTCHSGTDGILACQVTGADTLAAAAACDGLSVDDLCGYATDTKGSSGACRDDHAGGLTCSSANPYSIVAPVDGIDLDECNQLYASDFAGRGVWRWTGPGTEAVSLVPVFSGKEVTSLRFGRLGAGWDDRTVYVYTRETGLRAIPVGVPGLQSR